MIFNSLGSNYNLKLALKYLFARASQAQQEALTDHLKQSFGGTVELYNQGRAALGRAVELSQAELVIVNGLTCYSVELAVKAAGARPLFADVKSASYHFDLASLKQTHQANPKAGAVIVQASYGLPIEIGPIKSYCQKHKLILIEDLAHSIGMSYSDGPQAGSVADLVMLSFGRDKHIDVAGGGALIIRNPSLLGQGQTCQRPSIGANLLDRLYPFLSWLIRASHCFRLMGKSIHFLLTKSGLITTTGGSPVQMRTSLAPHKAGAVLEQLNHLKTEQTRRLKLWGAYNLSKLDKGANPLRLPLQLDCDPSLTLHRLAAAGYSLFDQWAKTAIYPAHYLKDSDYQPASCPQAEKICPGLLELPLHRQITPKHARQIAKIVRSKQEFRVVEPPDEASWQAARRHFSDLHFSSSWLYGQSQIELGNKLIRRLVYKAERPVALIQAVVRRSRRGTRLELVGGPLLADLNDQASGRFVVSLLRQIARDNSAIFVRLWPRLKDSPTRRNFLSSIGLKQTPAILVYDYTSLIDLTKSEDELMAGLRMQTRQRLRQAQKKGIRVDSSDQAKALEPLLKSLRLTASYQGFGLQPLERIRQQYQLFLKSGQARVYHAYDSDGQLLNSALVILADNQASYRYGATTQAGRRCQGAYLLQWQIIRDAKAAGCQVYDLWGMAPPEAGERHPAAGYTTFKRGFGGSTVAYLPSYDLVLVPTIYRLVKLIGRLRDLGRTN